ncbi:MAG: hypothetical protein KatS3mg115_0361 [Candidatus Poribacteria bacterium]|nr:MAG: hypothetical protein KatS3mg115_0361 [Candidatus Poribacteria bacterium]
MATPKRYPPVKPICGVLYADPEAWRLARGRLEEAFGSIESETEPVPFVHTAYYESEMGPTHRLYLAFERLRPAEFLVEAKWTTNRIETELRRPEGGRRVNLDIGYLSAAKVVLATMKDYGHRIYLGRGVLGDVELHYQSGAFRPWPWTYPDYAEPETRAFFVAVRRRYLEQLRRAGIPATPQEPWVEEER